VFDQLNQVTELIHPGANPFSGPKRPGCRGSSPANLRMPFFFAALCLLIPGIAVRASAQAAPAAEGRTPAATAPSAESSFVEPESPVTKKPVESDLTVEGLVSYGNYRIFASSTNCKIGDIGIEYARHSWGRLLGARMDYVGEVEPVIILNKPTVIDVWGITKTDSRVTVPGAAILPIGLRMMWLDNRGIKPYLMAKAGVIGFTQKVPAAQSTYESFTLQSSFGLQVRMNESYDLRLGLFGDFHFSNGFITPVNPGLDVMNAQLGITYHLGSRHRRAH
jgi:Lipid A 3-O-deacylase (PagL)